MTPNGKTTFEIFFGERDARGFHLRFTKPVDTDWLAGRPNFDAEQQGYGPTAQYKYGMEDRPTKRWR